MIIKLITWQFTFNFEISNQISFVGILQDSLTLLKKFINLFLNIQIPSSYCVLYTLSGALVKYAQKRQRDLFKKDTYLSERLENQSLIRARGLRTSHSYKAESHTQYEILHRPIRTQTAGKLSDGIRHTQT